MLLLTQLPTLQLRYFKISMAIFFSETDPGDLRNRLHLRGSPVILKLIPQRHPCSADTYLLG